MTLQAYIGDFSTTLSSGYTSGGTSLNLTSLTGANGLSLPTEGEFYLKVEDEYFKVTSNSGSNPLTVVGGQWGSTNISHSSGAPVTGCEIGSSVLDGIRDYRADILNGKPFGTKNHYKREYYTLANGATVDLLPLVSGNGIVDCIWIGVNKTSTLKVYIDGEGTASINIDLRDLFFSRKANVSYASGVFLVNGGDLGASGCCGATYIPIPFASSIQITLTNTGGSDLTLFSDITYQTGIPNVLPYQQKLFIATGSSLTTPQDTVVTFLNYTGGKRGRLLGVQWATDGTQLSLEGNFKLYKNSESNPSLESSGAEDFFFMSGYFNYFNEGTVFGDSVALTRKDNSGGHFAAFRMFLKDPFVFDSACKVTWNVGDTTEQNYTGNSDVYWSVMYYLEL